MSGWLAGAWSAIWPNLAASVLWATPAFVTHHVLLRRHISRVHAQAAPDGAAGSVAAIPAPRKEV